MTLPEPERLSAASCPWQLEAAADGTLSLVDAAGRRHERVELVQAFPISAASGPVAVLSATGRELLWIESLAQLPSARRELVSLELARRDFMPVVERVVDVSIGDPAAWRVETDRGPCTLRVAAADEIHRRPDGSGILTDVYGVRYLLPGVLFQDGRSRRLIERNA